MTEKEFFIILVSNEALKKADAIVLLEGDGYNRVTQTAELFHANYAKKIVISGGMDNLANGSFHSGLIMEELRKKGVGNEHIILETQSKQTREQAVEVMKLVKQHHWKKILLVASNYHQYRAYLTFLQVMFEEKIDNLQIINAPVRNLQWFAETGWGTRFDLAEEEFKKIEKYSEKGHLCSFAKAIDYQKWKEQQA